MTWRYFSWRKDDLRLGRRDGRKVGEFDFCYFCITVYTTGINILLKKEAVVEALALIIALERSTLAPTLSSGGSFWWSTK